jgi:hypothetical protein
MSEIDNFHIVAEMVKGTVLQVKVNPDKATVLDDEIQALVKANAELSNEVERLRAELARINKKFPPYSGYHDVEEYYQA